MNVLHDQILAFLLGLPLFKDVIVAEGKLEVGVLKRKEIISLYKLRLEIAVEKSNEIGIKLCSDVVEKISRMNGVKLYSISYKVDNREITGFIDEHLKEIYIFSSQIP